jgi:hypothetical protein
MLVLFAHDGDNAWAGGYSYFNENVTQFSHAAAAKGYRPSTVAQFLATYPVASNDIVHVEDGGWVNADGDFGSPQFINWNWPLVNGSGQSTFRTAGRRTSGTGLLTAATNRVITAEQIAGGTPSAAASPTPFRGTTPVEKAWHFLLVGYESGYMYYGKALDFEVKPTLAVRATLQIDGPLAGRRPDRAHDLAAAAAALEPGRRGGSLWVTRAAQVPA